MAFKDGDLLSAKSFDGGKIKLIPGNIYYSELYNRDLKTVKAAVLFKCLKSEKRRLRSYYGIGVGPIRIVQNIYVIADSRRVPREICHSGITRKSLLGDRRKTRKVELAELPLYVWMPNKYDEWDRLISGQGVNDCPSADMTL